MPSRKFIKNALFIIFNLLKSMYFNRPYPYDNIESISYTLKNSIEIYVIINIYSIDICSD